MQWKFASYGNFIPMAIEPTHLHFFPHNYAPTAHVQDHPMRATAKSDEWPSLSHDTILSHGETPTPQITKKFFFTRVRNV